MRKTKSIFLSNRTIFSLWKDVTFSLKQKNVQKATESKTLLEQTQRNDARERQEKSIKWDAKVRRNDRFLFVKIDRILLLSVFWSRIRSKLDLQKTVDRAFEKLKQTIFIDSCFLF